jgi:hypothetical protein
MRVLIAEDEVTSRHLLQATLELSPFSRVSFSRKNSYAGGDSLVAMLTRAKRNGRNRSEPASVAHGLAWGAPAPIAPNLPPRRDTLNELSKSRGRLKPRAELPVRHIEVGMGSLVQLSPAAPPCNIPYALHKPI